MMDILANAYMQWAEAQLSTDQVQASLEYVPLAGGEWMLRIELWPKATILGHADRITVQEFAQWVPLLMAWRKKAHLPVKMAVCLASVLLVLGDSDAVSVDITERPLRLPVDL